MNNVIYKYPLRIHDQQTLLLPSMAQPLTIQLQDKEKSCGVAQPCLWARVDPTNPQKLPYSVWMVGTGHQFDLPGVAIYLGTVQHPSGLVLHCFGGF
jgi:hypothetical protein